MVCKPARAHGHEACSLLFTNRSLPFGKNVKERSEKRAEKVLMKLFSPQAHEQLSLPTRHLGLGGSFSQYMDTIVHNSMAVAQFCSGERSKAITLSCDKVGDHLHLEKLHVALAGHAMIPVDCCNVYWKNRPISAYTNTCVQWLQTCYIGASCVNCLHE